MVSKQSRLLIFYAFIISLVYCTLTLYYSVQCACHTFTYLTFYKQNKSTLYSPNILRMCCNAMKIELTFGFASVAKTKKNVKLCRSVELLPTERLVVTEQSRQLIFYAFIISLVYCTLTLYTVQCTCHTYTYLKFYKPKITALYNHKTY